MILGANLTGVYDQDTVAHVKGLQALVGLPRTGVVNEKTADAIDSLASRYVFPEGDE